MEKDFKNISELLFNQLDLEEDLILSFSGENSQFIRFNNASVRQTGLVDDAEIELKFMANNRICSGGFTISGNKDIDHKRGIDEISRLRREVKELPEDPFIVLPKNLGSSVEKKSSSGLKFEDSVDAILPVMSEVDFVGIFSNGKMYRGNANSKGQNHWFETDTYSLDYSLVTPGHQMVKGSFSGNDWNQKDYEEYVNRSKEKLSLMNRNPIKMKTGNLNIVCK